MTADFAEADRRELERLGLHVVTTRQQSYGLSGDHSRGQWLSDYLMQEIGKVFHLREMTGNTICMRRSAAATISGPPLRSAGRIATAGDVPPLRLRPASRAR